MGEQYNIFLKQVAATMSGLSTMYISDTMSASSRLTELRELWAGGSAVEVQRKAATVLEKVCAKRLPDSALASNMNVNEAFHLVLGRIGTSVGAITFNHEVNALCCFIQSRADVSKLLTHFVLSTRFRYAPELVRMYAVVDSDRYADFIKGKDIGVEVLDPQNNQSNILTSVLNETQERSILFNKCRVSTYDEFTRIMNVRLPRIILFTTFENANNKLADIVRRAEHVGIHVIQLTTTLSAKPSIAETCKAGLIFGKNSAPQVSAIVLGTMNKDICVDVQAGNCLFTPDKWGATAQTVMVPNPFE